MTNNVNPLRNWRPGLRLNRQHPLARGLVFCSVGGVPLELVTQTPMETANQTTSSTYGLGWSPTSRGAKHTGTSLRLAGQRVASAVVVGRLFNRTDDFGNFIRSDGIWSPFQTFFGPMSTVVWAESSGGGNQRATISVPSRMRSMGVSMQMGNAPLFYVDGAFHGAMNTALFASSDTFPLANIPAKPTSIGSSESNTEFATESSIAFAGVWNRILTPAEICAIDANPWQMFEQSFHGFTISSGTSISTTDAGSGSEAILLRVSLSASDTATGTDAVSLGGSFVANIADAVAGAEGVAITVSALRTDAGTGLEALTLQVIVSVADTGAGSDAVLAGTIAAATDFGSTLETATVQVSLLTTDVALGLDVVALSKQFAITDLGTGTDSVNAFTQESRVDCMHFESFKTRSIGATMRTRTMTFQPPRC